MAGKVVDRRDPFPTSVNKATISRAKVTHSRPWLIGNGKANSPPPSCPPKLTSRTSQLDAACRVCVARISIYRGWGVGIVTTLLLGVMGLALAGSMIAFSGAVLADGPGYSIKDTPPPAPVSWTGFYAGANAGHAWGHSDASTSATCGTFVPFYFNCCVPQSRSLR